MISGQYGVEFSVMPLENRAVSQKKCCTSIYCTRIVYSGKEAYICVMLTLFHNVTSCKQQYFATDIMGLIFKGEKA